MQQLRFSSIQENENFLCANATRQWMCLTHDKFVAFNMWSENMHADAISFRRTNETFGSRRKMSQQQKKYSTENINKTSKLSVGAAFND